MSIFCCIFAPLKVYSETKSKHIKTMARPKKVITVKEPVRIREKVLKDRNISLYFDIYNKGVRKYEFLHLYIVPETDFISKTQNKKTREIAEQIKAERILSLQKHGIDNWSAIKRSSMPIIQWLKEYENGTGVTKGTLKFRQKTRLKVEEYLASIHRENLALDEIDKEICQGYIAFLSTAVNRRATKGESRPLSQTSKYSYQNVFSGALNLAVKEELIDSNPFLLLDRKEKHHPKESVREYLTLEEVKALIKTDCMDDNLKHAFLFSCFVGLRLSDIRQLTWEKIIKSFDGNSTFVKLKMQKTQRNLTLPLSNEALKWLPQQGEPEELVFKLPSADSTVCKYIQKWVDDAGIKKDITFHCARHTFGTMMLTLGADLYTVSKLLGHRNIQVTQVYAKIVDKKKTDAMNLVDGMFE